MKARAFGPHMPFKSQLGSQMSKEDTFLINDNYQALL